MSQIDLFQTIILSLLVLFAGLTNKIRFRLDAKIKRLEKELKELEDKP